MSWSCPRATRAVDLRSLRRLAWHNRHGRSCSRDAARMVVGPLAEWSPRCVGRKGGLGPGVLCARFAGRHSDGSLNLQRLERDARYKIPRFIYPTARGRIHHPRLISTTGHRPHKQPEHPQMGDFTQKWPDTQDPQNHTTTTSPWG